MDRDRVGIRAGRPAKFPRLAPSEWRCRRGVGPGANVRERRAHIARIFAQPEGSQDPRCLRRDRGQPFSGQQESGLQ